MYNVIYLDLLYGASVFITSKVIRHVINVLFGIYELYFVKCKTILCKVCISFKLFSRSALAQMGGI